MFVTTLSYPGIDQFESASATINHGITPGSIVLKIKPQDVTLIALNGSFVIVYSDGITTETITMVDCNTDSASYVFNSSGEVTSLILKDFRWQWQFGAISGEYNVQNNDGTIRVIDGASPSLTDAVRNSETTPRELATLLFDAMGVTAFDVSALPNTTRPRVSWDYANPAQELAQLVEPLNCDIVPAIDGSVAIRKRGDGAALPAGPIESTSSTINPIDQPKNLKVVTAPIRLQVDFDLEAVGEDIDGSIKLLDDLSYCPVVSGWGITSQINLSEITDHAAKQVAERSVLKWFRIKPPTLPVSMGLVFGTVDCAEQFLPLLDGLVETITAAGAETNKPEFVYGKWWIVDANGRNTVADINDIAVETVETTHSRTIIAAQFSIDRQRGIVKFSNRVTARKTSPKFVGVPVLRLRASSYVRGLAHGGVIRHHDQVEINASSPSKDRYVVRNDILPYYITNDPTAVVDNLTNVIDEIEKYLTELAAEYAIDVPVTATYGGILNIALDGAIRSVSWTVGSNGSSTIANWNDDQGDIYTPTHRQRQRQQKITRVIKT